MRPDRFTQLLLTAARSLPDTTAGLVTEDGKHNRPYLVAVTSGGKTSRWQVVATSAPGDRYSEPEAEPVLGDKPEPPTEMVMPAGSPEQLEQALIAAVLAADAGEIAAVDLYSRRAEPPKGIGQGATIVFHDASKIYINRV